NVLQGPSNSALQDSLGWPALGSSRKSTHSPGVRSAPQSGGCCVPLGLPVVLGLAVGFVLTSRLYHYIHQRLLSIDIAFHSFPRELSERHKRKWLQQFRNLACRFHVGVHLLPGQINQLPLGIDERLGCLSRQCGQLGFLDFL